jgi:DNA-binding Xre family transcriptional regulator
MFTQVRIRTNVTLDTIILEVISLSVKDAVTDRFRKLCQERNITVNELANTSGVTPSTAYSMMDHNRRDVSIVTIKKFCDGLEITLGEFFSTPEFDELEQEIQ